MFYFHYSLGGVSFPPRAHVNQYAQYSPATSQGYEVPMACLDAFGSPHSGRVQSVPLH